MTNYQLKTKRLFPKLTFLKNRLFCIKKTVFSKATLPITTKVFSLPGFTDINILY